MVKTSSAIIMILIGVIFYLLFKVHSHAAYLDQAEASFERQIKLVANAQRADDFGNEFVDPRSDPTKSEGSGVERYSPYNRIQEEDIHVYNDRVVLDIENPEWAKFTDTNSMDPVLDDEANAIQIVPMEDDEIYIGDIISYTSTFTNLPVIHRVVETGEDEIGWYARAKGDNNIIRDPGKIRMKQIKRVTVGIIY